VEITHQRLDMVVEHRVVVELKSTERLHPDAERQLLGYLHATTLQVGLLLHFGRSGKFRRVIHTRPDRASMTKLTAETDLVDFADWRKRQRVGLPRNPFIRQIRLAVHLGHRGLQRLLPEQTGPTSK
jgi:hypothetical protein